MSCLVTALFYDSDDMERAIEALIAKGIPPGDLSLMLGRATAGKYFAPADPSSDDEGGVDDGPLAALAANLVAATSGSAAILATGPLMRALAERGTHAYVGGISAGLSSLGMAEHEAAFCEYRIRSCDALLLGVTTSKARPEGIKAYLRRFDASGARDSLASAN